MCVKLDVVLFATPVNTFYAYCIKIISVRIMRAKIVASRNHWIYTCLPKFTNIPTFLWNWTHHVTAVCHVVLMSAFTNGCSGASFTKGSNLVLLDLSKLLHHWTDFRVQRTWCIKSIKAIDLCCFHICYHEKYNWISLQM